MNHLFYITSLVLLLSGCGKSKQPAFDRIVFHTSMCFGSCPVYHLELNKDKKIKLFAESVSKGGWGSGWDTAKMGYFSGFASDTSFNQLSAIIKTIGIDTLTFKPIICCDGSLFTIIVYRDGKRRYLHSMFPPAKAYPLIGTLYEICKKSNLKRTSPFKIEQPKSDLSVKDIRYPPPVKK
jgi:hypothetical protein